MSSRTSPFIYEPSIVATEFPALDMAARKLGLLDDGVFHTGVSASQIPTLISGYLTDAVFTTVKPGEEMPDSVLQLNQSHRDSTSEKPRSGVRIISGKPTIWVEEIDGVVNIVDVLREFGAIVEIETTRLLGFMKGQSELTIKCAKRIYTFSRSITPSHYLISAGFNSRDASREHINGHAAVLQSLALALLLDIDPRMVFIDVFERAREDPVMFNILGAMALRSGIDFADRDELRDYARDYFELLAGDEVYYPNLHQINSLAGYFAQHLRLNVRAGAGARAR